MHLTVVSAGLSVPSSTRLLADRLTEAVREQLADAGRDVEIQVVKLRDLAADIANNLVTGFPSPSLSEAAKAVASADGLIAVTPVFSASYSGLFKSFFDVIDKDTLTGKAVLAAATGGTARHSLALEHALRPLFSPAHHRSARAPPPSNGWRPLAWPRSDTYWPTGNSPSRRPRRWTAASRPLPSTSAAPTSSPCSARRGCIRATAAGRQSGSRP
ncbi:CE1759 family FMN reductase [Streptomyces avermitilis]|uniref:CE1759 family FMN reductase n=1 Tax=Streptomyces avermitilis TaxID=33903 RepID=UPI003F53F35F